MVKHATITVVAILLAVTIAVSSSPFHDGWKVKYASQMAITGFATNDDAVDVEVQSFWEKLFKIFFKAVEDESAIDLGIESSTEAPTTGNRMDDEVAVSEPDLIDDELAQQIIDERIPCDIRLGFCRTESDTLKADVTRLETDVRDCGYEKGAAQSSLSSCSSRRSELETAMAKLKNPALPPRDCDGWLISLSVSCNQFCAEKNRKCYGAVIRDLGDLRAHDDVCAPSQCYDDTVPRCWTTEPSYQSSDRDEDLPMKPFRECTCCT